MPDIDTVRSWQGATMVDPDQHLSEAEEQQLWRHYGLDYGGYPADTADRDGDGVYDHVQDTAVGRDTSGPTTDDAMTRSEEELRVGTETRERGRVRLRKYVTTEQVTRTVPVQREEVRVEREPITDAVTDERQVAEPVRKEQVEVEGDQERLDR
jgi:stress response protein YsnF